MINLLFYFKYELNKFKLLIIISKIFLLNLYLIEKMNTKIKIIEKNLLLN